MFITMKNYFGLVVLSGILSLTPAGYAVTISQDGIAKAVIVVSGKAGDPERHAAAELVSFLKQVTGAEYEIANKPAGDRANIFVGPEAAQMRDPAFTTEGLKTDGIVIKTIGRDLILAGGRPRGTLYAVYTFLEDSVGCHWWSSRASTTPHRATLTVDNLNVRYVPVMELRDIYLADSINPDWSVRNKRTGLAPAPDLRAAMPVRGGWRDWWPWCHSFYEVLPPAKYFQSHPEWYTLIDGKRAITPADHASLCQTNKAMRKQYVENFRAEIRKAPNADYTCNGPPDDSGFPCRCQCPKCTAFEAAGNATDLLTDFTNDVAAGIEKDFPNKPVFIQAYHFSRQPPQYIKPRPNVGAIVCSIECSTSVSFDHERNREFRDDFIGWSKLVRPGLLFAYIYMVNFEQELLPHPNLWPTADDIKFLAAHGCTGIFAQGFERGQYAGDMIELKAWVAAKLMWDPSLDTDKLVKTFVDGYYGPAGKDILAYLKLMQVAVTTSGDWLGIGSPNDAKFLSPANLCQAWACLKNAQAAVADNPELLRRVKVAQMPVLYTFLVRWSDLRDKVGYRGLAWPLPTSYHAVYNDLMQTVKENGYELGPMCASFLSKSAPPGR